MASEYDWARCIGRIEKDEKLKKIPVTVFTTSSGQKERLICEAYGVEMVTKPYLIKEFKRVLNHLLVAVFNSSDVIVKEMDVHSFAK